MVCGSTCVGRQLPTRFTHYIPCKRFPRRCFFNLVQTTSSLHRCVKSISAGSSRRARQHKGQSSLAQTDRKNWFYLPFHVVLEIHNQKFIKETPQQLNITWCLERSHCLTTCLRSSIHLVRFHTRYDAARRRLNASGQMPQLFPDFPSLITPAMVVSYVLIHACNLGHVRNGHTSLGAYFASEGGDLEGQAKRESCHVTSACSCLCRAQKSICATCDTLSSREIARHSARVVSVAHSTLDKKCC